MQSHLTPNVTCTRCGKIFHVIPAKVDKTRYCSRECMNLHRRTDPTVSTDRVCETCGTSFKVRPYQAIKRKFCSKQCHHKSMIGNSPLKDRPARFVDKRKGYVYIKAPNHPNVNKMGYVAEHRLVAEEMLGRFLERYEIVHHINDDGSDNRPENLQVMTQPEHVKLHKAQGQLK